MSTFGTLFKVTTFGESHCKGVGAIVDGVPGRMCATDRARRSPARCRAALRLSVPGQSTSPAPVR